MSINPSLNPFVHLFILVDCLQSNPTWHSHISGIAFNWKEPLSPRWHPLPKPNDYFTRGFKGPALVLLDGSTLKGLFSPRAHYRVGWGPLPLCFSAVSPSAWSCFFYCSLHLLPTAEADPQGTPLPRFPVCQLCPRVWFLGIPTETCFAQYIALSLTNFYLVDRWGQALC